MDAESYSTEAGTTTAQLVKKVQPVTPMLTNIDPPRHTHLRSADRALLHAGRRAPLEPRSRRSSTMPSRRCARSPRRIVFDDFAARVSVKVACLANGFPMEDSDMLNGWVWRFFGARGGRRRHDARTASTRCRRCSATSASWWRSAAPPAPTARAWSISSAATREDGRRFDVEAASSHLSLFLIGGAETFPKTFASTVLPPLAARGPARGARRGTRRWCPRPTARRCASTCRRSS